ncbi:hypothetical protein ACFFSY_19675 [Paenibacillus aurantiacus]|uniref:Uncharacterized protein n=1 Tax=Paenibacillus aurantiacus TaxID=1936118 RepID=A0ABV5KSF5_9BACL
MLVVDAEEGMCIRTLWRNNSKYYRKKRRRTIYGGARVANWPGSGRE